MNRPIFVSLVVVFFLSDFLWAESFYGPEPGYGSSSETAGAPPVFQDSSEALVNSLFPDTTAPAKEGASPGLSLPLLSPPTRASVPTPRAPAWEEESDDFADVYDSYGIWEGKVKRVDNDGSAAYLMVDTEGKPKYLAIPEFGKPRLHRYRVTGPNLKTDIKYEGVSVRRPGVSSRGEGSYVIDHFDRHEGEAGAHVFVPKSISR